MTMSFSGLETEASGRKSMHNYISERAACGFDIPT